MSVSMGQPYTAAVAAPGATPAQQAADLAQAQVDYVARAARCKTYNTQQFAIAGVAGLLGLLIFPGWWKLLSPIVAFAVVWNYPHSVDCDYGGI